MRESGRGIEQQALHPKDGGREENYKTRSSLSTKETKSILKSKDRRDGMHASYLCFVVRYFSV
jgi:hypothetical protein